MSFAYLCVIFEDRENCETFTFGHWLASSSSILFHSIISVPFGYRSPSTPIKWLQLCAVIATLGFFQYGQFSVQVQRQPSSLPHSLNKFFVRTCFYPVFPIALKLLNRFIFTSSITKIHISVARLTGPFACHSFLPFTTSSHKVNKSYSLNHGCLFLFSLSF